MPQCLLVSNLAQFLATPFLILLHSMMSTAEQIKNVTGHQAKCTVVLGLVLSVIDTAKPKVSCLQH